MIDEDREFVRALYGTTYDDDNAVEVTEEQQFIRNLFHAHD